MANRFLDRRSLRLAALCLCAALLPFGCGRGSVTGRDQPVRVAYIGLTCEAPIFVAYEKGFFREQGVNVRLVKTDWDAMKDGLGLDRFEATHTLVAYVLKPIEQGMDVRISGGIHRGCLRVQAGVHSGIRTVADLRGKRIAVSNMGSPPFLFANRALAMRGFDVTRDIHWVVYPADAVELALDRGLIDAVADSEPIGTMLMQHGKVRNIIDQAKDAPFKDQYCCVVAVSGKWAAADPAGAAGVTRALLKAAKWVQANPTAAASLAVEKGYLASTVTFNSAAISQLNYAPGVEPAHNSLEEEAVELKQTGLLNASTDPAALVARAWLPLDGVTDQWIAGTSVDKVAGGGPLPLDVALAALLHGKPCCNRCCLGG